eukprot:gnl/TRDRNA2_/TRDRNA2_92389_c0_seq1.p1 gnl/TRDRNA2_/TRDRNA2_92389_c0~~gnl/TRDRNA2_/TRDRNA2_92389_c0_seq1.p1  ORF type:complete len:217 (+),score=36.87 gnl/TRDRNA2_/TRDRNA2_92389_c0_seq1:86-652(+)
MWRYISHVQLERAKKAALVADNAVLEAERQQAAARYHSRQALAAEAQTMRALRSAAGPTSNPGASSSSAGLSDARGAHALPVAPDLEPRAAALGAAVKYPVPPSALELARTLQGPSGLELPQVQLVDPGSNLNKMAIRAASALPPLVLTACLPVQSASRHVLLPTTLRIPRRHLIRLDDRRRAAVAFL